MSCCLNPHTHSALPCCLWPTFLMLSIPWHLWCQYFIFSVSGRVSLEGNGAYSMSKHALVAYTNTLRLEMKKWGVDVCIVEPTGFFTGQLPVKWIIVLVTPEYLLSIDLINHVYYAVVAVNDSVAPGCQLFSPMLSSGMYVNSQVVACHHTV